MPRFLLERTDQGGGFVAPPGSGRSYTKNALDARFFATREEAERERCVENERIVDLDALIRNTYSR